MCEIKTVSIVAVLLLVAAGVYTYKVYSETKLGQQREIKSGSPCEEEYKKFCLNGGECYYVFDEDIVAFNCAWLYEGKRCEKYMWWD